MNAEQDWEGLRPRLLWPIGEIKRWHGIVLWPTSDTGRCSGWLRSAVRTAMARLPGIGRRSKGRGTRKGWVQWRCADHREG